MEIRVTRLTALILRPRSLASPPSPLLLPFFFPIVLIATAWVSFNFHQFLVRERDQGPFYFRGTDGFTFRRLPN